MKTTFALGIGIAAIIATVRHRCAVFCTQLLAAPLRISHSPLVTATPLCGKPNAFAHRRS